MLNEELHASGDWDESPDNAGAASAGLLPATEPVSTPVTEPSSTPEPAGEASEAAGTAGDADTGQQPRERDANGRYRRPQDRATPADAPRIAELTGKWRAAERERDELRQRLEALEAARQDPAPRPVREAPEPRATSPGRSAAPADDPEPVASDAAKYPDGVYDPKYQRDLALWAAREELRNHQTREATTRAEEARLNGFRASVAAARAAFPDFETVAFNETHRIPQDGPLDRFIMEDEDGAFVLYHLRKHPSELADLLALPALQQLKRVSVLADRLKASTRPPAATTGSAAAPQIRAVPRPPNPVRTSGPVAADAGVPDPDDDNLDSHMKHYYPKGRARSAS